MTNLAKPGRITQSWLAKQALVKRAAYIPVSELVDIPGIPEQKWTKWKDINFASVAQPVATQLAGAAIPARQATRQEIEQAQNDQFDIIKILAKSVVAGTIRSLFLTGGAGMGKSYTIYDTFHSLAPNGEDKMWAFVSGKMGQSGLFKALYDYRFDGQVLVVDDADGFLKSEDALNIIKAATDTKKVRRISWNTEYQFISDRTGELMPKAFEFCGALVVISNKNFNVLAQNNGKLQEHFEAIVDRAAVVNLNIETQRDRLIRLRSVARQGKLFGDLGLTPMAEAEVLNFLETHMEKMNRISFRTALKVGGYRKHNPTEWERLTKVTEFIK